MTPEELAAAAKKAEEDKAAAALAEQEKGSIPYARFQEVNTKKNELERRLAEIELAQKKLADDQMIEQGKHKELAEKYRIELEAAKKNLEDITGKASAYEKSITALVETELAGLPKEWQDMVPEGSPDSKLAFIAKLKAKLPGPDGKVKPAAPPPAAPRPATGGEPPDTQIEKTKAELKALDGKTDPESKRAKFRLTNKLWHLMGGLVGTQEMPKP